MSHSETIPIPICHACGAGAHWDCSSKSNVDAIRRVEGCECDCPKLTSCPECENGRHYNCSNKRENFEDILHCNCDTCDQIREDALQDKLASNRGKEGENDDGET
jgi:hypothetical protein